MAAKTSLQGSYPSIGDNFVTQGHTVAAIQPLMGFVIPRDLALPARNRKGPPHARKQENPHAPKPRNAFILFRCYLDDLNLLPDWIPFTASHIQVSRIAGHVWSSLPSVDREIFYQLVEEEKKEHAQNHPEYKYTPRSSKTTPNPVVRSQSNRMCTHEEIACRRIAELIVQGFQGEDLVVRIQDIITELSPSLSTPKKSWKATSTSAHKQRSSISKKMLGKALSDSLTPGIKSPRRRRPTVSSMSSTRDTIISDINSTTRESVSLPLASDSGSHPPSLQGAGSASTSANSSLSHSRASSLMPSPPDNPFPVLVRDSTPFNGFDDVTIPPPEYGEDIYIADYGVSTEFDHLEYEGYQSGTYLSQCAYAPSPSSFGAVAQALPELSQISTEENITTTIEEEWMEYLNIPQIIYGHGY